MYPFPSALLLGAAATPALTPAHPNHYRAAYIIEATGQSNGTGYTSEESRNGFAITYNGSAAISSGKFEFNGTTDYISLPHSILLTPGSKFTLEVFGLVLDAVNTGTNQTIVSQYEISGNQVSWTLDEQAGNLVFGWSTSGNNTTNSITIGTVTAGVPCDLAVCWDGSTVYSLKNGAQGGSAAFTGNFMDSNQPLKLGAKGATAAQFLDGRFEAFIFTRGECLYAASGTHTVPSLPRTIDNPALTDSNWGSVIALIGYDSALSRIRDFGPYDLRLSPQGNAAGSTVVTLADGSPTIAFDGSGDYIDITDDALVELGGGDFTIETFARHSVNTTQQWYAAKWSTPSSRSWAFGYRGDNATDVIELARSTTGSSSSTSVDSGALTPTLDTFYHMAVCRSGDNYRLFSNGAQTGSATLTGSLFNGAASLQIGALSGGNGMNGYLTQVRITKAARYTSNFTAPTGALPTG